MNTLLKITEKIVEKKISRLGSIQTHILLNWHHIAEQYAEIALPESIKFYNKKKNDGQITLKVQSGFGPEIKMAIPFLLNQINARFGYKAISKIKILQADIGFINKEEKVTNKNILENSKTFLSDELHDNELRLVMRKFELSRKILPS